jgi:uridine kinase
MVLLVGIGGGSGSGKTTLAEQVAAALPSAVVVPADAYYRDLAHLPPHERAVRNFDEPAALDGDRLCADLRCLAQGRAIARPSYDFTTHTRGAGSVPTSAAAVVVVEGIFVLALPAVRELLALGVFVEASEVARLARRVARDVRERGRTPESVAVQFFRQTKPMHELHVEPSRAFADLVVSGEDDPASAAGRVLAALATLAAAKLPA